jgi:hypothetical protein
MAPIVGDGAWGTQHLNVELGGTQHLNVELGGTQHLNAGSLDEPDGYPARQYLAGI